MSQDFFENKLVLQCPTCGQINRQSLRARGKGIAAYWSCVAWGRERPAVSSVVEVKVTYPFCCVQGDCFASTFGLEGEFIQARMLDILSKEKSSAMIRAEIVFIGNRLSYVERLSAEELEALKREGDYEYSAPEGDAPNPQISLLPGRAVCLSNSYGGGDVVNTEYIYTDEDGVDHLVEQDYSDFESRACYFGDEVLGLHRDCPVYWENGLLIHREEKMVVYCKNEVENAVVPDGVEEIGWLVFSHKYSLKSLLLPASVLSVSGMEFLQCPNLKRITLFRANGSNAEMEATLRRIFPAAEILYADD